MMLLVNILVCLTLLGQSTWSSQVHLNSEDLGNVEDREEVVLSMTGRAIDLASNMYNILRLAQEKLNTCQKEQNEKLDLVQQLLRQGNTTTNTIRASTTTSTTTSIGSTTTNNTTTPTTPTTTKYIPGLVITGGSESVVSVETFPPTSCNMPDFPGEGRRHHSLSLLPGDRGQTLVACGGQGTWTSCFQRQADTWIQYATIDVQRRGHSAWTLPSPYDGMVLLGGVASNAKTTSMVGCNNCPIPFRLVNSGEDSCSIPLEETIVLTGGFPAHSSVDRYTATGTHTALPNMKQARREHACGSYTGSGGVKVLLVAGGSDKYNMLDSTEILTLGSHTWQYAAKLPRALYGARAAVVSSDTLLLTGGADDRWQTRDEVYEYQPHPTDRWVLKGKMSLARWGHAIVATHDITAFCGGQ